MEKVIPIVYTARGVSRAGFKKLAWVDWEQQMKIDGSMEGELMINNFAGR